MLSLLVGLCIPGLLYLILRWSGWFSGTMCSVDSKLEGKVVVVTGGNTGIGKETVLELCRRGATVVIGARDLAKGETVAQEVRKSGGECSLLKLDLSDIESIKLFASQVCDAHSKVDMLVNNAGLMMPVKGAVTKQGMEMHMGVNHLGHHLLTHLLWPRLVKGGTQEQPARVINVSSDGHKFTMFSGLDIDDENFGLASWAYSGIFSFHQHYGQSKLAQIYHASEVSRLAAAGGEHVVAYSLHPGAVKTEITRYHNLGFWMSLTSTIESCLSVFGKTPWEGAQTTLHLCLAPHTALLPGAYYVDCKVVPLPEYYRNVRHQKKLWIVSDRLMQIKR